MNEATKTFIPEKEVPKNGILILQEPDGNWKGYMWKFDKLIETREVGPETALQKLLTHSGETH